jgi:tRNA threonylcarbamoyladenosine biosynthesis protein TsaB
MITLAFDTASERCTVAATDGVRVAGRYIDGPRRHAAVLLTLFDEVLSELGTSRAHIGRVLTGDGPGSFTGLRVAAAAAKALAWHREVEWRVAPSLLVRAMAQVPAEGGVILALSDALRGELYAGCWRVTAHAIERVGVAPRAMAPAALAEYGDVDVITGSIPVSLVDAVIAATGRVPISGAEALPDARWLIALDRRSGGTSVVDDPAAWEPEYGRPAEAQAVWERAHGRSLPAAPGVAR